MNFVMQNYGDFMEVIHVLLYTFVMENNCSNAVRTSNEGYENRSVFISPMPRILLYKISYLM